MRHENPRTDLVEQGGDRVGDDGHIERPGVGRHRAEVLIERLGVLCELHAGEVVRPQADAEHAEPQLLVRRRRDRALDHAAAGVAAPRLVDRVHAKAAPQKDGLIAFASIGCGLPRLRELPGAVPEHERQLPRIHRHLIERVGMIAAERLARGRHRLVRIEGAGALRHRAADREAALLLDRQRRGLRRLVRRCCSRHKPGEQGDRECAICMLHVMSPRSEIRFAFLTVPAASGGIGFR